MNLLPPITWILLIIGFCFLSVCFGFYWGRMKQGEPIVEDPFLEAMRRRDAQNFKPRTFTKLGGRDSETVG